jgi:hypothetical protein
VRAGARWKLAVRSPSGDGRSSFMWPSRGKAALLPLQKKESCSLWRTSARIVVGEVSKLIGGGVGFAVLIQGFRRGWKLARVRTQLQDLDGRLRSVDWSYVNRARTQLQGLEARLRSVDSLHANRMRAQLQDIDARLRAVDWSYANLIRTSRP